MRYLPLTKFIKNLILVHLGNNSIKLSTVDFASEFDRKFEKSFCTGKSLSEALLFAEHRENMLCTEIVQNVKNNFCIQHVLPMF